MEKSLNDLMSRLRMSLGSDFDQLEDLIASDSCGMELVGDVVDHLIKAGGKRLRPILVLLICKMFGCSDDCRMNVAVAIEFIHNATLLHDDVIDESESRHGLETANNVWGNKASILVGDFLLTRAFQLLIGCQNHDVLTILSQAAFVIVGGEINQMISSQDVNLTESNYLKIISAKTASLFAASCESAAVISKATETEQELLKSFGENLGMAFQITDDTLDYVSNSSDFGKKLGNDFYSGKATLPLIIAYQNADEQERKFWQDSTNRDFTQALAYIKKHDAITKSLTCARNYLKEACKCLYIFPDSLFKSTLLALLSFVEKRHF